MTYGSESIILTLANFRLGLSMGRLVTCIDIEKKKKYLGVIEA